MRPYSSAARGAYGHMSWWPWHRHSGQGCGCPVSGVWDTLLLHLPCFCLDVPSSELEGSTQAPDMFSPCLLIPVLTLSSVGLQLKTHVGVWKRVLTCGSHLPRRELLLHRAVCCSTGGFSRPGEMLLAGDTNGGSRLLRPYPPQGCLPFQSGTWTVLLLDGLL